MNTFRQCVSVMLMFSTAWLRYALACLLWVLGMFRSLLGNPVASRTETKDGREPECWEKSSASRIYTCGNEAPLVTVQTSTHSFQVDLGKLSDCSEYFRALSQSRMKETAENLIHLEHIPSGIFRNLLEFTFLQHFEVAEEELQDHIEVGSYLLARPFVAKCLGSLSLVLNPQNCQTYLDFSKTICCAEMLDTVHCYLSAHLFELPHLTRSLEATERELIVNLRSKGVYRLCTLKKENLTSGNDSQTEAARYLYSFVGSEHSGSWCRVTKFPFMAEKWSFTTAVLHNYLFVIGGYRHKVKRGFEFRMASFRYNPFTDRWISVARLIKHRRHFSTAVCGGYIYAVGGWYLDTLVAPDSSTALYTAVERYNPWTDSWAFVSSLPLTDYHFTMSLSHDIPLASALHDCVYVIGTIQRTREKLILQYNVKQDSWTELLPTLTRADAEIPSLYFLGATDKLHLIGGNNFHNVVTSFCVESRTWGEFHATEKMALAGQGTVYDKELYMPAVEHNSVMKLSLQDHSISLFPLLPIASSYEALFHLVFPEVSEEESRV